MQSMSCRRLYPIAYPIWSPAIRAVAAVLDDKSLLELCLKVSGRFENSTGPTYTTVSGNFDGQGISCGILQWNAGQNTLQTLVTKTAAATGWDKAKSFFSSDIQAFAGLRNADAVAWCLNHYIQAGTTHVDPAAAARWVNFLQQPECVAAQISLATNGVLGHAKREVAAYAPDYADSERPYVFFFDLITQEGGMTVGHHTVPPVPAGLVPDVSDALALAQANSPRCHDIWQANLTGDNEAALLLHYAYARAMLAKQLYVWDACSRRGTVACRAGIVHGSYIDLTAILD